MAQPVICLSERLSTSPKHHFEDKFEHATFTQAESERENLYTWYHMAYIAAVYPLVFLGVRPAGRTIKDSRRGDRISPPQGAGPAGHARGAALTRGGPDPAPGQKTGKSTQGPLPASLDSTDRFALVALLDFLCSPLSLAKGM